MEKTDKAEELKSIVKPYCRIDLIINEYKITY
jgi:hypothetical protein